MGERGNRFWQIVIFWIYFYKVGGFPLIPTNENVLGTADESEGIVEDDIKLTDFSPYEIKGRIWLRSAMERTRIWTNGVVPYHIDENYFNDDELLTIRSAIEEFHNKTCIRFEAIRTLSLGPSCLDRRGTIIHELMHILGFWHEQNRADRDDYVTIKWSNIRDGLQHNFYRYGEEKVSTMQEPYDYQSIMHYSSFAFAKDPHKPTIETKIPVMIGQRFELSQLDIKKLHKLYNCAPTIPPNSDNQPLETDVVTNQLTLTVTDSLNDTDVTSTPLTETPVMPNFADLIPLPFKFNWTNDIML
ncbi:hypothetical protein CHUAL_002309 [Chamberlinius hualienensis]